jgi:hypothetical protein
MPCARPAHRSFLTGPGSRTPPRGWSRLPWPGGLPARLAERKAGRAGRNSGACRSASRNYLVKYQYSGTRVNSGLKVTFFSLLVIAWIPNGLGSGTHMNGSCSAP